MFFFLHADEKEGCLRKQHFVASQIERLQYFDQVRIHKLEVTSYKLEGNEFVSVTWKMHLLCFKGCVTYKPELYKA